MAPPLYILHIIIILYKCVASRVVTYAVFARLALISRARENTRVKTFFFFIYIYIHLQQMLANNIIIYIYNIT